MRRDIWMDRALTIGGIRVRFTPTTVPTGPGGWSVFYLGAEMPESATLGEFLTEVGNPGMPSIEIRARAAWQGQKNHR